MATSQRRKTIDRFTGRSLATADGDYRLQFRVEGVRVIVEKVGHRDRFYER